MPNFFSTFTSEVFKPLVTLLIPGAIAISTWFVGLLWHFHDLRTLVVNNHAEVGVVLVLAMTFAGLVLEDRVPSGNSSHSDTDGAVCVVPARSRF